jgi:hypothetical protein
MLRKVANRRAMHVNSVRRQVTLYDGDLQIIYISLIYLFFCFCHHRRNSRPTEEEKKDNAIERVMNDFRNASTVPILQQVLIPNRREGEHNLLDCGAELGRWGGCDPAGSAICGRDRRLATL